MYWKESKNKITVAQNKDWFEISYDSEGKDIKIIVEEWEDFKEFLKTKDYLIGDGHTIIVLDKEERQFLQQVAKDKNEMINVVENI